MSFIPKDLSVINIKLTNAGRQALAEGRLNFAKFALGDSEIDYGFNNKIDFDAFNHFILRPKDGQPDISSFILRENDTGTTFTNLSSIPSNTSIIENPATTRGFFDETSLDLLNGSDRVKQPDIAIDISFVSGGDTLTLNQSPNYLANATEPEVGDYLLVKWANPNVGSTVTFDTNQPLAYIWYKIENILSGSLGSDNLTVQVDKPLPDYSGGGIGVLAGAYVFPNNNDRETIGDNIQNYYGQPFITDFFSEATFSAFENTASVVVDVPVWNMAIIFIDEVIGVDSEKKSVING
jgi:hypothetical protein